jgi:hypothetical protein
VVRPLILDRLRKKLHTKYVGILVIVLFLFFSLRVINWFEYPNILISGDYRPPLVQEAFAKRVLYTWDEADFGMLSVYAPRILVPSYFFMLVLQALGVSLYFAQMIALFLMLFLASVLMFIFMKRLSNGNVAASLVAALYFTSNLYMVNDREVTAIGFLDVALVIMPSLILLTEGVIKRSYKYTTLSGLLFVLTYGSFPNYRLALLCLIVLVLFFLFMIMRRDLGLVYRRERASRLLGFSIDVNSLCTSLKNISTFIVAGLLASIWILTLVATNSAAFFQTYKQMGVPQSVLNVQLHDVLRLIAKWGFYSGSLGKPYIPYANVYLHNPLAVIVSYLPPILAFASLLLSKSRKLTIYFSAIAVLFSVLSSGFNPFFSQLYLALTTDIPLMIAFRESAQWSFLVIISYSILIGLTFSALYNRFKNITLKALVIGLAIMIFLASSYPLTTGSVTTNWLNPSIKGSLFPDSYADLNGILSDRYWTLLLPQRATYVIYNFSGIPLSAGNPYPMIFSKPIISGLGTEYLQSDNLDLLNEVYGLMLTNASGNVALGGSASESSVEKDGLVASQAIDGNYNTRWASEHGMPQSLEIHWILTQELSKVKIVFENAYANDYTLETWNGSYLTGIMTVENNTSLEPEYTFPQPIPTTMLRIVFTKALPFNMVSIWELQAYTEQSEALPKFLGVLGVKYLVLEKNFVSGNLYDASELKLDQNDNFVLDKDWSEISLYDNTYALQKLYVADNILKYATLDGMFQTAGGTVWSTLQHSALSNLTSLDTMDNALVAPGSFTWSELSPTSYSAHVQSKGAFVLVFLESYDDQWKVSVNGNPVDEANHLEVNAFANGWLINSTGRLTITVQYEIQNLFFVSVVASLVLPVLLLAFFARKDLRRIAAIIGLKLKPLKAKLERKLRTPSIQPARLRRSARKH